MIRQRRGHRERPLDHCYRYYYCYYCYCYYYYYYYYCNYYYYDYYDYYYCRYYRHRLGDLTIPACKYTRSHWMRAVTQLLRIYY